MKFHEKIKTNIDWSLFFNNIDLVHDDKPLYIPNFLPNPNKYVTWKNIENYLNFSQGNFKIIDDKTRGDKLPPTLPTLYDKKIQDKNFIHHNITRGLSFKFSEHSFINSNAASLCSEIDNIFKVTSESQVMGSSKPNSLSFPTHMDSNPIFVFQIQGEIKWTLYSNRVTHLGFRDLINRSIDTNKLTDPQSYTLSPGDFLYIPERTYHDVKVNSPRLTLSVSCFNTNQVNPVDRNYYQL